MSVAVIRRWLLEMPDLYANLALFVVPGSGGGQPSRGVGSTARLPARLDVFELTDTRAKPDMQPWRSPDDYEADRLEGSWRQGVIPLLASWSRLIDAELHDEGSIEHREHAEHGLAACSATCTEAPVRALSLQTYGPCSERTAAHWDTATVSGECGFLLKHLEWAARQQWFPELADDLATLAADLRSIVRERGEITLRCPTCHWRLEGQGDYDAEHQRYSWYRCTGCGDTRTTAGELDRVQRAARDVVTLRYAADKVGKPASTLREWKRRGWISPLPGHDTRGQVYSLKAVRRVARKVRHGQVFQGAVAK